MLAASSFFCEEWLNGMKEIKLEVTTDVILTNEQKEIVGFFNIIYIDHAYCIN